MKQGDWTWKNRRRGEDLQLDFLLPWSQWLAGSYRVPAAVGVARKQLVEERILEQIYMINWRWCSRVRQTVADILLQSRA